MRNIPRTLRSAESTGPESSVDLSQKSGNGPPNGKEREGFSETICFGFALFVARVIYPNDVNK